jgi:hypothetical protein
MNRHNGESISRGVEVGSARQSALSAVRVELRIQVRDFPFPPMPSALLIGRNAGITGEALASSLERMSPEAYETVRVDDEHIAAVVLRKAAAPGIPLPKLVQVILRQGSRFARADEVTLVDIELTQESFESLEL